MVEAVLQVTSGVERSLAVVVWVLTGVSGLLVGYLLGYRYGS
jgi:hypothetical protein